MPRRSRRAYDHRIIKEQIIRAGNPDLLPELEIPRSTAVRVKRSTPLAKPRKRSGFIRGADSPRCPIHRLIRLRDSRAKADPGTGNLHSARRRVLRHQYNMPTD
jgi:hypothetical protein